MATVKERYNPHPMAANATLALNSANLGGFIAVTAGTLTVTATPSGTVLVNALPVTAGGYYPLPMSLVGNGGSGATITLAGGASGTILV